MLGVTPSTFASVADGDAGVLGYDLPAAVDRLTGAAAGAVRPLLVGCPALITQRTADRIPAAEALRIGT